MELALLTSPHTTIDLTEILWSSGRKASRLLWAHNLLFLATQSNDSRLESRSPNTQIEVLNTWCGSAGVSV